MNDREIIETKTFGDKLKLIEEGFQIDKVLFSRWMGISVNDYTTKKYRGSIKKPTKTWQNLLFAIRHFGTWWLPYAQYEPVGYEEIAEYRNKAMDRRRDSDLFALQPIVGKAYSDVVITLANALFSFHANGMWRWDDTFCTLHELGTSVCVRLSERDIPNHVTPESTTYYDIQIVRMLRSLIDLFGVQIVQRKGK